MAEVQQEVSMPDGSTRLVPWTVLSRTKPDPVTCPVCGQQVDAVATSDPPFQGVQIYTWRYCSCMAEALALAGSQREHQRTTEQERLDREAYERTQGRYWQVFPQWRQSRRVPKQTFDTFRVTPDNRTAYARVKAWGRSGDPTGFYLTGPSGTGKSHLVRAMVHGLIEQRQVFVYTSVPYLLERLRPEQRPDAPTMDDILTMHSEAQCVVWDDLGAEKASEWVHERLYLLVDALYEAQVPLVIASNNTPNELTQHLGPRIMSRIVEMCPVWSIKGADARVQMAKQRVMGGESHGTQ